jgi:FAD/FMN-containing dehydrogenase
MNYASQDQDVFKGYGTNNERRLRRIQREYDPDGVFKRLQPGYFKLN